MKSNKINRRRFIVVVSATTAVVIFVLCVVFTSCKDRSSLLELSSKELLFTPESGYQSINVACRGAFNAISSSPWCIVGIASPFLKVSVSANETPGKERMAKIAVTCGNITDEVTVKQLANMPFLDVENDKIYFSCEQNTKSISCSSNETVEIASSDRSWLSAEKLGNNIVIQATKNTGRERTAHITVSAGKATPVEIDVKQESMKYYDVEISTLCKADYDYPRHSEASIIELKDGTLLVAWIRFERSPHGSGDGGPTTIPLMNSSDGGRTWGNLRIGAQRDQSNANVYSPNFLRLQNGDILLIYKNYYGSIIPATIYGIRSSDEGKTFSAPEPILERTPFHISNSCVKRLSSGRIILPVEQIEDDLWRGQVRVCYSDDDCRTFTIGQKKIELPMRGASEPFVAELKDRRLIMVMRNQLGSLYKSYSSDMGESWSPPQPTVLTVPESCPYVTNIPGSDKIMVIWNNAKYDVNFRSHYGKRSPLTAAISDDGGVTFTDFWDIETDPKIAFSNPGITWTKDGVCLLTYWACPYSEDWVMNGMIDLKLARFRVRP